MQDSWIGKWKYKVYFEWDKKYILLSLIKPLKEL